ncbi:MAG: hypothetical protein MUO21_03565, partial [Nitrososphaeraceae archaeon]|nr:hypothetical protein [Nitrososphaeraceae archaeon]
MGIPGLHGKYLREINRRYKGVLQRFKPALVSSLSFDLNGLIHGAIALVFADMAKAKAEDEAKAEAESTIKKGKGHAKQVVPISYDSIKHLIFSKLEKLLFNIIELLDPLDAVIIAVDGPAPDAKLRQQKIRRHRSANKASSINFDTNAVTPGTQFMIELDIYLVNLINSNKDKFPPIIIYSSHLVPGEGEHKIMDYYRNGDISGGIADQQGGVHIIYGMDADLIMLSLGSNINNIYLVRETIQFGEDKDETSISDESDDVLPSSKVKSPIYDVINIDRFKEYLVGRGGRPETVDDYIIFMCLLGNDFLPKMPSLEDMVPTIELLLDIYSSGNYKLSNIDNNGHYQINYNDFSYFLEAVSKHETDLLKQSANQKNRYPSRFHRDAFINGTYYFNRFRTTWYANALGPKGDIIFINRVIDKIQQYQPTEEDIIIVPSASQIKIDTISPFDQSQINNMCFDYIRTIAWVFSYYKEGTSRINPGWVYPHFHTPLLVDLFTPPRIYDESVFMGYQETPGIPILNSLYQLVA